MPNAPTFFATSAKFRAWLQKHHKTADELWVGFYKKATGKPSITWQEAVDEALCFGWIDSLIKRLDEARYARKFTPRKADSNWSNAKRQRYAQLKATGRLMPAGLNRAPDDRPNDRPRPSPLKVPPYIHEALKKRPSAWKYFENLPPSHRRLYVGWIDSAKREETKMRRLKKAVTLLSAGQKLGLI